MFRLITYGLKRDRVQTEVQEKTADPRPEAL